MKLDEEIKTGFRNLHDTFMNASLMRHHMLRSPLTTNIKFFDSSDRIRFERLWIALLAVLIESWDSGQMHKVKIYISSKVLQESWDRLIALLRQGRKDGSIQKMIETRHYMFHRDTREFWDIGRIAPFGKLIFHDQLHMAFSSVLLTAFQELIREQEQA